MPEIVSTILAFVFALGTIIFVHESGHLLVAKAFGMRVLTFSLGFGKRLFGWKRGETDYRVSLFPLGGYVKLGGELPDERTDDPKEFLNRPRWQRIVVYLAGPTMNVVLAILLIAIVFMIGIEVPDLQDIPPVLGTVEAGSSAAAAGLQPGDTIVEVKGKAMSRWQDVGFEMMTSANRPLALTVDHNGVRRAVEVTPGKVPNYDFGDTAGMYPVVRPRVMQVLAGAPAEAAGFKPEDTIRKVDGKPVTDPQDFVQYIETHASQLVKVEVDRAGQLVTLEVTPLPKAEGKGKIGISVGVYQRFPPGRAIVESAKYNWHITQQTFAVLGKIFKREIAAKSALSGPIEIASMSGAAARSGFKNLLYFMGFISISIGILNLLPVPILDGGQITILIIEGILRRDLSMVTKERLAQVGFVMLMALMATVLYFDTAKRFFK
ncbi:MAG: RIP metalloprotease RseP [Acidobacteriota bacterium]